VPVAVLERPVGFTRDEARDREREQEHRHVDREKRPSKTIDMEPDTRPSTTAGHGDECSEHYRRRSMRCSVRARGRRSLTLGLVHPLRAGLGTILAYFPPACDHLNRSSQRTDDAGPVRMRRRLTVGESARVRERPDAAERPHRRVLGRGARSCSSLKTVTRPRPSPGSSCCSHCPSSACWCTSSSAGTGHASSSARR
jgi:hypothetical protein